MSLKRGKAHRLRVLVVEDHEDSASCLDMLLTLSGFEVAVARDGLEALQVALQFQPEVALIDLVMPGMDGYALARRFREQAELQKVLLIAVTGLGEDEFQRRSHEEGFTFHLVKPVDPVELVSLLAAATRFRAPELSGG
jgi:CheY-like chemotaxis protein